MASTILVVCGCDKYMISFDNDILRGCHFLLELTYILVARDNSMKLHVHSPVHEVDPYLAIVHHFNSIGKS